MNILIVDDSAAVRKILARVLSQLDLPIGQVIEAADGEEALAALAANQVGLVLTDVNMPKMDGLTLLRQMKASPQLGRVPVVLISTEGAQGKVTEAAELGAMGYIKKPFSSEQVREKLMGLVA